jgi:hypothetical protein
VNILGIARLLGSLAGTRRQPLIALLGRLAILAEADRRRRRRRRPPRRPPKE